MTVTAAYLAEGLGLDAADLVAFLGWLGNPVEQLDPNACGDVRALRDDWHGRGVRCARRGPGVRIRRAGALRVVVAAERSRG